MAGGLTSLPRPRVVVLAKNSSWAANLPADIYQFTTAACGYEAAAHLLDKHAQALVIELALLGPGHMRLIEIARQLGVEILAFGRCHSEIAIEQLSGVRLASLADLPDLLKDICSRKTKEILAQPSPQADEKIPLKLTPAKKPPQTQQAEEPQPDESDQTWQKPSYRPAAPPPGASPNTTDNVKPLPSFDPKALGTIGSQSLLTPEELAALLEKEL